jgi:hypothetical protein
MTVSQVPRQGKEIWTKWEDSRRIRRSPTPSPQAWRLVMARPFGSQVQLSDEIRNKLEILNRASSTPQALAFRCRIIRVPRRPMILPIYKSPMNSAATDMPSANGASVSSNMASLAFKTFRAPADPGAFPPSQRIDVFSIATSKTEAHDQPATRWTLDNIAATIVNEASAESISRSTIYRILQQADLKPHRSVYWLNSHDPDFRAKAREICQLYLNAPLFYQQGRLVVCCDEKTGMQILQRNAPKKLILPGKPAKIEFEYTRLGTLCLMSTFVVPTGEVVWDLGSTRTSLDFRTHLFRVACHFKQFPRIDWIVDNLNTHCSLELCEILAYLNRVPFEPQQLMTMVDPWLSRLNSFASQDFFEVLDIPSSAQAFRFDATFCSFFIFQQPQRHAHKNAQICWCMTFV